MNRTEETKLLIDKYLNLTNGILANLFSLKGKFRNRLIRYSIYIHKNKKIDIDYFKKHVIPNEEFRSNLYFDLNKSNAELLAIFIRLWNLHQDTGNQISSSINHFNSLTKSSKTSLIALGFELIKEEKYKHSYSKNDGLVVEIVYQKYDPPEVWITKKNHKKSVRLGNMLELYLNGNDIIWQKHSGENNRYFDYSKFDYYYELITSIFDKLLRIENLADDLNKGIEEQYNKIKNDL